MPFKPLSHAVLEARAVGDKLLIIYDYIDFPRGAPARNLFAYSIKDQAELWRAEDIGLGALDAYTRFVSDEPLMVANFAGLHCRIDIGTGCVIGKTLAK